MQETRDGFFERLSALKIHLDEDADSHALLTALRQRGQDVTSTREQKLMGLSDAEQLAWAGGHGRTIFTYNAIDFCRLHNDYLSIGREHAGIIIAEQQKTSVGEEMRQVLRMAAARDSEAMMNRIEFLGNWK